MLTQFIQCNNCLSINHFRSDNHTFAYECYNCYQRSWINESAEVDYMLINSIASREEASKDLQEGFKVRFAQGILL